MDVRIKWLVTEHTNIQQKCLRKISYQKNPKKTKILMNERVSLGLTVLEISRIATHDSKMGFGMVT